jgi:hypothetical protein
MMMALKNEICDLDLGGNGRIDGQMMMTQGLSVNAPQNRHCLYSIVEMSTKHHHIIQSRESWTAKKIHLLIFSLKNLTVFSHKT